MTLLAFLAPFAIPLHHKSPQTCTRPPARLRMCANPPDKDPIDPVRGSKKDRKEDASDPTRAGSSVKDNIVSDFQEVEGQAGIAVGTDDLLAETETVVELGAKAQDRNVEKRAEEKGKEKEKVEEKQSPKVESKASVVDQEKPKADVKEEKPPGVRKTPEQIEKAKVARAEAQKVEEEEKKKKAEKNKQLVSKAENLFVKIGTKSKAFELGEKARARAELFVDDTIKLKEKEGATQQDKLKGSAATAAKSVVAALVKVWEEKLTPQALKRLPEGVDISSKALASAFVGFFVAIVLLPTFFGGGGEKPTPAKKKLDADTASLEKKLARERSAAPSEKVDAQKKVFPPEDKVALAPPKAPLPAKPVPPPVPKVAEVPQPAPEALKSVTPAPAPVTPPPTRPIEPPAPAKPVQVTPQVIMASVTKALGTSGNLITSASFESLSEEPTVVLQVTKAFHRLPAAEQKLLADKALKSTRPLGYERVSFVEEETGMEVAHAGIDIDLEDEAANLRAQLASTRKQSDKLASQNTNQYAEIDALNTRLSEQRDEYATKKLELENIIKNLQGENSGLLQDLSDAKEEIAKIPDRLVLEERTLEAEKISDKLRDTVEMISKQLTRAREEEALAKQKEADSLAAAKEAVEIKDKALATVDGRINSAREEAENRATAAISSAQNEAKSAIAEADKRVQEVENARAASEKDASRTLEETKKSYEKQLADTEASKEKEVQTIQSKYESMLDEVQRKAKVDLDAFQKEADKKLAAAMKEAKTVENTLIKERDQAQREVTKSEERAQKAAARAESEKASLKSKIEKLQARLSFKNARSPDKQLEIMEEEMGG